MSFKRNTQLYFPSMQASLQWQCEWKNLSSGVSERELTVKRPCRAPCSCQNPILVSVAPAVYLAWHFHNNHYGLSHSGCVVGRCLSGHRISQHSHGSNQDKPLLSTLCVCVCVSVCWMSQFLIHEAIAVLYNTVDKPITFPFHDIILPFIGAYADVA